MLNADWHHGVGDDLVSAFDEFEVRGVLNADWHHGVGDHGMLVEFPHAIRLGAQRRLASRGRRHSLECS